MKSPKKGKLPALSQVPEPFGLFSVVGRTRRATTGLARVEKMTRHPIFEENKKPLKPEVDDQSHKPAEHIEETARLASSVETAKDLGKVRRTKD
ncbi:MAG: hypothetical protein ACXV4B_09400 [Halobacteriota archaeon]